MMHIVTQSNSGAIVKMMQILYFFPIPVEYSFYIKTAVIAWGQFSIGSNTYIFQNVFSVDVYIQYNSYYVLIQLFVRTQKIRASDYPVLVVISTHAVVAIVVIIIQCVFSVCMVCSLLSIFFWYSGDPSKCQTELPELGMA